VARRLYIFAKQKHRTPNIDRAAANSSRVDEHWIKLFLGLGRFRLALRSLGLLLLKSAQKSETGREEQKETEKTEDQKNGLKPMFAGRRSEA